MSGTGNLANHSMLVRVHIVGPIIITLLSLNDPLPQPKYVFLYLPISVVVLIPYKGNFLFDRYWFTDPSKTTGLYIYVVV